MTGANHYLKNGTKYNGAMHTTNGIPMTGAKHTKGSRNLFHKNELSAAVRKKIK